MFLKTDLTVTLVRSVSKLNVYRYKVFLFTAKHWRPDSSYLKSQAVMFLSPIVVLAGYSLSATICSG
jgi:hypothetical protein